MEEMSYTVCEREEISKSWCWGFHIIITFIAYILSIQHFTQVWSTAIICVYLFICLFIDLFINFDLICLNGWISVWFVLLLCLFAVIMYFVYDFYNKYINQSRDAFKLFRIAITHPAKQEFTNVITSVSTKWIIAMNNDKTFRVYDVHQTKNSMRRHQRLRRYIRVVNVL